MSRPVISSAFATQATSSQFSAVVGGLPLMKVISVFFFTIRRSSVSVITLSSGFSTFSWNSSLASRSPPEQERSEEHTSELQSRGHLVCRLLLENKKKR